VESCTQLTVRQAFTNYVTGGLPWIYVQRHMVVQEQRPYARNLQYLMSDMVEELKQLKEWDGRAPVSTERAAKLFDLAKHTIGTVSKRGRKLAWRTAATYLRKEKREEACAREQQEAASWTHSPAARQEGNIRDGSPFSGQEIVRGACFIRPTHRQGP